MLFLALFCQTSIAYVHAQNKKATTNNAQSTKLVTATDSVSFFLGYNFGKQVANSEIDNFNVDAMTEGVRSAINHTTVISEEDMYLFMNKYFTSLQQKTSTENLKKGQDFLAANAKKPGVVVLPSGLQYKVIKEGSGAMPEKDDNVEVVYHGTLMDGSVFDSSKERGDSAVFQAGRVIPGFSEALLLMKEGSIWEVYIPADLAYGENSPSATIKPNSVLIFEINLIKILGKDEYDEDGVMFEEAQ